MVRAYSLDLRERVVGAAVAGQPCRAVAATFGVNVASIVKWSQRFRSTGSAAAFKMGGRGPFALAGERDWPLARITAEPDLTLRAIAAELAERSIRVSYFAVWHFSSTRGSVSKNPARQRAGSARRRPPDARRKEYQGTLDPTRLVFIDETWAKTNMTRTHGRCARGQRLVAKVPHGRWRTVTFLAALRHDRIGAPCVFDGPSMGGAFWPMSNNVSRTNSLPPTSSLAPVLRTAWLLCALGQGAMESFACV